MSKDLKKLWTPAEDQRLLELKAAGKANAVIGHALRRSTSSIVTRIMTLTKSRENGRMGREIESFRRD
jgi:hypothetical protein